MRKTSAWGLVLLMASACGGVEGELGDDLEGQLETSEDALIILPGPSTSPLSCAEQTTADQTVVVPQIQNPPGQEHLYSPSYGVTSCSDHFVVDLDPGNSSATWQQLTFYATGLPTTKAVCELTNLHMKVFGYHWVLNGRTLARKEATFETRAKALWIGDTCVGEMILVSTPSGVQGGHPTQVQIGAKGTTTVGPITSIREYPVHLLIDI